MTHKTTSLKTKTKVFSYTEWFLERDKLPQTDAPYDEWYTQKYLNGGWGPKAKTYPIPTGLYPDIVTVARHYIGLPYQHHHIPAWNPPGKLTGRPNESQGLDCSNYTAWVYNYGRGLRFTSDVQDQSEMYKDRTDMTLIQSLNNLVPGDLLYFWRLDGTGKREISHTGLFSQYINDVPYLIDAHRGSIEERPLGKNSWYSSHFSHAIHIKSS